MNRRGARIRNLLPYALLLAFLAYAVLRPDHSSPSERQCEVPIRYRIGTIDSRFGISRDSVIEALRQAVAVWETPAHKTLFVYDESAGFPVNLVYADQQISEQSHAALGAVIEKMRQDMAALKQARGPLEEEYSTKDNSYKADAATFDQQQQAYNAQVDSLNRSGGASQEQRRSLEAESSNLSQQQGQLEIRAHELDALRGKINDIVDQYNAILDREHSEVAAINRDAGKEFVAGNYVVADGDKAINIYEFSNMHDFVGLLAHELGHALGLGHNNNPQSIMSPSKEVDANPDSAGEAAPNTLSPDDLGELKAACQV